MKKNYNEFRSIWFGWEDKLAFIIFDFPLLLIRKYNWFEKEESTWLIQVIGINLFSSITKKIRRL